MEVKLTNRVTMLKATGAYMAEKSTIWNSMARLQTERGMKCAETRPRRMDY